VIACVIHGAKELKIENRAELPHPQYGEVLVRFGAGGIYGSDLHYYHEGGILDFDNNKSQQYGAQEHNRYFFPGIQA